MPFSSVLGANSVVKPGVCTSATRPSVPYDGQMIYETDTNLVKVYEGAAWVTVGPRGILQVVTGTTTTTVSTTSTSYVTTNLTATITPSSTSSKILLIASLSLIKATESIYSPAFLQAFRGTVAGTALTGTRLRLFVEKPVIAQQTMITLDSPNTASAQAYTIGITTASSLVTVETGTTGIPGTIMLMEVSA
jgi:hypothetical protein